MATLDDADAVGQAGAAVQRGQPAEQPGRAQRREVGGDQLAEGAHGVLHRRGGGADLAQPLQRVASPAWPGRPGSSSPGCSCGCRPRRAATPARRPPARPRAARATPSGSSRSAVEHSHSTTSLIDAPCALPRRLASSSGSDSAAKTRWLVIDTLKGVGGGIFSSERSAPRPSRRSATDLRALCQQRLAQRHDQLADHARLAQRVRQRRAQQLGHAQLVAVRARARAAASPRAAPASGRACALPSATPAWPSMAAWCTLV